MEASVSLDTPQGMKDWIHNVQQWIEDDIVIEDSGFSEQHEIDHNMSVPLFLSPSLDSFLSF